MNRMQAWSGMFAISNECGLVSPDYTVFEPTRKQGLYIDYFGHLLKTPKLVEQFAKRSKGIGSGFNRLYTPDFGAVPVISPPPAEQAAIESNQYYADVAAIARYLDHADRRIRRCIHAKEKLVKLLEEQRQTLINEVVTGRVDVRTGQPYPAYKPSGVEWLGDVPAHWEVRRLKTLCSKSAIYGANVAATAYAAAGVRFIRTTDITEDGILRPTGVFLPREAVRDYILTDCDLLISRSGTIGRSFLYRAAVHGPCAYAGYLVRFVLASRVSPEYTFLFTKTPAFGAFLQSMAISSTIENVNASKYANCPLPVPPLTEQVAIARYLDNANERILRGTQAAQREIDLLKEYETRLIADVVTGKLDVREAVSGLANDRKEVEVITGLDDSAVTSVESAHNANVVTQASEA